MKNIAALHMVLKLANALNAFVETLGRRPIATGFGTDDYCDLWQAAREIRAATGLRFEYSGT